MSHPSFSYPLPEKTIQDIQAQVIKCLKTIYDPDIKKVSIYDLGLIYDVLVDPNGIVYIKMTLTTAGCPFAQSLPASIERKINTEVAGVVETQVDLVWDPPWSQANLSEAARLELGLI